MGISTTTAKLLIRAKQKGVNFSDLATIGRQTLYVPREEFETLAGNAGVDVSEVTRLQPGGAADDFFKSVLGAKSVIPLDYSSYQGAEVLDLNKPVQPDLHGRFDALIDGGTLEHVFDVRQALSNYMRMIKEQGNLFVIVPANNLVGHGFYQFSPELFYRAFSKDNGFEIKELILIESPFSAVEASKRRRCYLAQDPARIGKRVRLVNNKPLTLFVHAVKLGEVEPFRQPPLQSDYVATWSKHDGGDSEQPDIADSQQVPTSFSYLGIWQEFRRYVLQKRKHSLRNKRFFKRLRL